MADDPLTPPNASPTVRATVDDITANPQQTAVLPANGVDRETGDALAADGYNFKRSPGQLALGWGLVVASFVIASYLLNYAFASLVEKYLGRGLAPYAIYLGPLATLVLMGNLDQNFWLSRVFGLQTGPNFSSLNRVLFVLTLGWIPWLLNSSQRTKPGTQTEVAAKPKDDPSPKDLFREVAETVVFVVILVLLLRNFVAEAFVIPTGSMATTLWGYQKVVVCPECGFTFPVNASSEVDPSNETSTPVTGCTCPNCHYSMDFTAEETAFIRPGAGTSISFVGTNAANYEADGRTVVLIDGQRKSLGDLIPGSTVRILTRLKDRAVVEVDATNRGTPGPGTSAFNPPANTGDRVLVMKCLYDTGLRDPKRGDVVVFKFPGGSRAGDGPQSKQVPINYIKRLVGLPGETIAIHGGKLYTSRALNYDWEKQPPSVIEARHLEYAFVNNPRAVELFNQSLNDPTNSSHFQIVRKPPAQVLAMRRPVYDNDFQPNDKERFPIRWTGSAGWQPDNPALPKTFTYTGDIAGLAWLRYQHWVKPGRPELITDFMGYNAAKNASPCWVGDLLIEGTVEVTRAGADDEVCLELSKGVDRFRAHFKVSTGECTLTRLTNGKEEALVMPGANPGPAVRPSALKGVGSHAVRFANVDERLLVWVDETLIFGDGVPYAGPKQEGPTENDLEPVAIGVKGAAVKVSGLKLWRDTYYTCQLNNGQNQDEIIPTEARSEPTKWLAPGSRLPVMTLYVQPGHYLCLGDNSPQSSDSRFWGLVPDRLLLGRALEVYFPFYVPGFLPVNRVGPID